MRQMEVTRKKIGDNVFYIKPFPAFAAANISGELSQVLAPILEGIAPLFKDEEEKNKGRNIGEMNIEDALPAFSKAMSGLDGDKMEHLAKRLLVRYKNVSVKGEITDGEAEILDEDMADEIFCGEIQDMLILCFEVVKVNFSGFFGKMSDLFGSLTDITEKKESKDTED